MVVVLTDDQGYPPLGAHGHPFIQTPHLDRFHGEAVRFEQFHSGTTCAPTRAGLLTGHYCNSTGAWHTVGGRSLLRADEWRLANAALKATVLRPVGVGVAQAPLAEDPCAPDRFAQRASCTAAAASARPLAGG